MKFLSRLGVEDRRISGAGSCWQLLLVSVNSDGVSRDDQIAGRSPVYTVTIVDLPNAQASHVEAVDHGSWRLFDDTNAHPTTKLTERVAGVCAKCPRLVTTNNG